MSILFVVAFVSMVHLTKGSPHLAQESVHVAQHNVVPTVSIRAAWWSAHVFRYHCSSGQVTCISNMSVGCQECIHFTQHLVQSPIMVASSIELTSTSKSLQRTLKVVFLVRAQMSVVCNVLPHGFKEYGGPDYPLIQRFQGLHSCLRSLLVERKYSL